MICYDQRAHKIKIELIGFLAAAGPVHGSTLFIVLAIALYTPWPYQIRSGFVMLSGTAVLRIPESLKDNYMETYISFVSADRKQLADSTYTGHFNK